MSARAIATGGAGYIGGHACKRLAAAGNTPVCVDSLENGHRWAVRWGRSPSWTSGTKPRSTRSSPRIGRSR